MLFQRGSRYSDFVSRHGDGENVTSVLAYFQNEDLRSMNPDRDYFLILVGGEILDARLSNVADMTSEEYAAIRRG